MQTPSFRVFGIRNALAGVDTFLAVQNPPATLDNLVAHPMQIPRARRACVVRVRRCRNWLDLYRTAVMEFDRQKLPESIDVAEKAIHQRLRELPIADSKELRELKDALNSLAVLKKML
jgi:hypothetical protein